MMETSYRPLLLISLITTAIGAGLAIYKWLNRQKKEFKHLIEFHGSLAFLVFASFLFRTNHETFVTLILIPWVWNLRTFGMMCEDLIQRPLLRPIYYHILMAGILLSVLLGSLGFDLPISTGPYTLCLGLMGLSFVIQSYQTPSRTSFTPLQHFGFFLTAAFFISRLTFPIWLMNTDAIAHWFLVEAYFTIAIGVVIYPIFSEAVFERQEHFLEEVLESRNKQLFSHSNFSEFKILSAGITHEINNALTIINAKMEQLIRKSIDSEAEKGLRVVQTASARIGKSIRGLREFIYPHDYEELLNLEDVVGHVLNLYGQRLRNHNVAVRTNGLSNKWVRGHRIQLEQVFLSMMNHSVESMDRLPEKWIEINGRSRNDDLEIIIRDSSTGIDERVETMLNQPFFITRDDVENGIRLILAKDIIEKHGGSMALMKNDEFTTFRITLPEVEVEEASHEQSYSLH